MEDKDNVIVLKPGESMHNYKRPTKSKEVKDPAEEALFKLNKEEQTKILESLGVEKVSIPRLEKERVALISKLQE